MISRRLRDESGFALVSVLVLMMVGTLFALAAWSTSNADTKPSARDRSSKQAYAAAEAGINYYMFRLGQNNAYWTDCDQVTAPGNTNPVNLEGATSLRWRTVPGTSAQYAIELIKQNVPVGSPPPSGSWCTPGDTAASTLLDSSTGTMQIRSTGQSGGVRRSVTATLRRSGFLDYLYFTDYETQDPQVTMSGQTCDVYRRAGRSGPPICSNIVFASDDAINGPFHTNDDILTCGTPDFGRTVADKIEIEGPAGYASGCGGSPTPNIKGTPVIPANHLTMPASNSALQDVAQANYLFQGTTRIVLNGSTMTVYNANVPGGQVTRNLSGFNGVIFVKNGPTSCGTAYSAPQIYNEGAGCAQVYVEGQTNSSITIGSERDIIVTGNVIRNGNSMVGLIANGFVRVFHPVNSSCVETSTGGPYNLPAIGSIEIDAAILSLQHSFIVDNYGCGGPRGTLTVKGAIAQKFRGPVGTGGSTISTGYVKNYNYDDRFKVANPPYFLDPVQSQWRKIRYTEESPARTGG